MSDHSKINNELLEYSRKLAMASNEYGDLSRDAANKRTDYDVRWAQELLKSRGKTVSQRESEAVIICEPVMREARIAEAMRDAMKERIRALLSVLNATQTRAAFLKAEMKFTNYET